MATPWWKYERRSKAYEAKVFAGMAFIFAILFGLLSLVSSAYYGQRYIALGWLAIGVFHSWRAWRASRKPEDAA